MKSTLKRSAVALAATAALAVSNAQARIVVDDNDTEVDIPEHVSRVVVTNILPLASAVTVFLNDGKTVVGMHPASYSAAQNGLLGKLYPDVLKADTGFMQGASLNIEALMALKPDLVLVNAPDKRTLDAVRNAGIPAFGISPTKWHYDIIETHAQWMKSLSEIWPEHKGKGELIDSRSKAIAKLVAERTKDLKPEERSKVLFLFRYDSRQIVGAQLLRSVLVRRRRRQERRRSLDGRQRQRRRNDGADLRVEPRRRLHHELHGSHARRPL